VFLITLDRESGTSLSRQIVASVIAGIEKGLLRPGDALPSTRCLAEELGISRFTASRAYEELWAEGYTEARSGSATRIRARPARAAGGGREGPLCRGLETAVPRALDEVLASVYESAPPSSQAEAGAIDFSRFNLDPRVYPVEAFRRIVDSVLRTNPSSALSYGPPAGDLRLRMAIARRMAEHGVPVEPDGIVITDGALHGLDLLFRLSSPPGSSIVCESPTFSGALMLAKASGIRAIGAAMDGEGLLPSSLVAAIDRAKAEGAAPTFLYTAPSFHNPTGSLSGQRRREAILGACADLDLPVVEDCFEEEIGFFGKLVKPMASMDADGRVIYLGTFSKVLFPGVRLGWMSARPALAEKAARLRAVTTVAGNSLVQAAMAEFLESGAYDAHVRRVNRIFARRLTVAIDSFAREVDPRLARLETPAGGYLLWVALGSGEATRSSSRAPGMGRWTAEEVARREEDVSIACAREGVLVTRGGSFWPEAPASPHLRLSIAGRNEEEIEIGMRRFARALRCRADVKPGPSRWLSAP
jgi:DNA-binding transcriptional MocR family regulator